MKTEFPVEIVVKWTNGGDFYNGRYLERGGRFTLYRDKAFPATKTFLNQWLKKIVPLDPWHEVETLTDLVEYLEYNVDRMKKEKVEYEATVEAKTEEINREIEVVKTEYQTIKKWYKSGKRPEGATGTTPSLGDVTRAEEKTKSTKHKLVDLRVKGRDIDRKLSGYQENLQIIRERLEVINERY